MRRFYRAVIRLADHLYRFAGAKGATPSVVGKAGPEVITPPSRSA